MKRTVTISLAGLVYSIDEDAYEMLKNYLASLKKNFSHEASAHEILSDIEARIAELFNYKLKNPQQVVSIADVQEVIAIMGTPEDFGYDSSADNQYNAQTDERKQSTYKRLFRDEDTGVIGGVCAGIAHYFAVDVVIVRLLFVLSFFVAGPLIYLVAWIVIPKAKTTQQKMDMRGAKLDIDSIKQRVKDEVGAMSQKANNSAKRFWNEKKHANFILQIAGYMMHALLVFFILVLFAVVLSLLFGGLFHIYEIDAFVKVLPHVFQTTLSLVFSSVSDANLAIFAVVLMVLLPLFLLLWGGVTLVLGIKQKTKVWGYGVLLVWITAICLLGIAVFQVVRDFANKGVATEKIMYHSSASHIQISQKDFMQNTACTYVSQDIHHLKHWAFIECVQEPLVACKVDYDFSTTESDSVEIQIVASSKGKQIENAELRARSLLFTPQYSDSTLLLPRYVSLQKNDQWRSQRVRVLVKIPKTKTFSLQE